MRRYTGELDEWDATSEDRGFCLCCCAVSWRGVSLTSGTSSRNSLNPRFAMTSRFSSSLSKVANAQRPPMVATSCAGGRAPDKRGHTWFRCGRCGTSWGAWWSSEMNRMGIGGSCRCVGTTDATTLAAWDHAGPSRSLFGVQTGLKTAIGAASPTTTSDHVHTAAGCLGCQAGRT